MKIFKNNKLLILLLLLVVGLFTLIVFVISRMMPVEVLRNKIALNDLPSTKQTSGTASASYRYFENYDQADKMADTIVIGNVIRVNEPEELVTGESTNMTTGEKVPISHVFTVSEVKVSKVIKGKYSIGDTIKVKQYGREYKGVKHEIDGVKYLQVGERHIFFLQSYENSPCSTINPFQGDMLIIDGKIKKTNNIQFINDKIPEDKAIEALKDKICSLENK